MASSKAHRFGEHLYRESLSFQTLSHPARRIIITYLLENGITSYKTLCRQMPLDQRTTSQHLRALVKSKHIYLIEKFPHSYYSPNIIKCTELLESMKALVDFFEKSIHAHHVNH